MSAEGIYQAFCLLKWVGCGGRLSQKGTPIGAVCSTCNGAGWIPSPEGGEECPSCEGDTLSRMGRIVGACSKPYDCGADDKGRVCDFLLIELQKHDPSLVFWLCPDCTAAAARSDIPVRITAHYNQGFCHNRYCPRGPSAGTNFLQMVIGPLPWR